jgi:hypothetical protein
MPDLVEHPQPELLSLPIWRVRLMYGAPPDSLMCISKSDTEDYLRRMRHKETKVSCDQSLYSEQVHGTVALCESKATRRLRKYSEKHHQTLHKREQSPALLHHPLLSTYRLGLVAPQLATSTRG